MIDDPTARLVVDGGRPLQTRPFPPAPPTPPVIDATPAQTLEAEFAACLGLAPEHVIAYGSHAGAYAAAFAALGVAGGASGTAGAEGPGEIVVPALLGEPLAAAARAAGLLPVPAEVEADAATLAPRGLARALSPRTAAIGVAHAFGHPAAMAELHAIAERSGVPVIEDASDALGAALRGTLVGRTGPAAVFALGAGHLLTGGAPDRTGGGALLVLSAADTAAATRRARDEAGADLDGGAAAIALAELRASAPALAARRCAAWELTFNLRGVRGLAGMPHGRWIHHAYDRYVVRLRSVLWTRSTAGTVAAIVAEGIPCEPACGPSMHRDPALRAALPGDERLADVHFPVATRLSDELIAIPLHAALTSRDMDDVGAVLRKVERWST